MKKLIVILIALMGMGCISYPYHDQHNYILKYNYMEKEYKYTHPQAELRYNYLEKRWEFAR